jgi:uncharacterized protein YdhG (YjbR/CyaY superfamily)
MPSASNRKSSPGGAATTTPDLAVKVRQYFAALRPEARKHLAKLREAIMKAAPRATENFSYGIPGFKLDGKPLVWYAAFKSHTSLYPITAAIRRKFAAQLEGLETSTGTVRFPMTKPIPSTLVRQLVKARIEDLASKTGK